MSPIASTISTDVKLSKTVQKPKDEVKDVTVKSKATLDFNTSDTITKLQKLGLKCPKPCEKENVESSEAEKIVELEAELEKLKMEMSNDKKKFEVLQKELEETREENKVLRENEYLVGSLTDKIKKMEQEKKELDMEVLLLVQEVNSKIDSFKMKLLNKEAENKVLREQLEDKKEEIRVLQENFDEIKPVPIKASILGEWKLKLSSCTTFDTASTELSMKDGNLHELAHNSLTGQETLNRIFPFDDPSHEHDDRLFAHTFIENNHMVTKLNWRRNGTGFLSIDRIVEGDLMTRTVSYKDVIHEVNVYKRVV